MPDLHVRLAEEDDDETGLPVAPLDEEAALEMLRSSEFLAEKLVPWGSNYTFAVGLGHDDEPQHIGIYKPMAGERPLWDFPGGTLYLREYAAYLLSRWLGWHLVPPTVLRDGPHGPGSLQLYVEPSSEELDERTFWGRATPELERMVAFDHLANNADRKIGHCLLDTQGRIWGIDHGLTFNVDPKLRTVLWQFSGEPISDDILADLARLDACADEIDVLFAGVLDAAEIEAVKDRAEALLEVGRYPILNPHINVPYGWW
jgi:hypothetical protein